MTTDHPVRRLLTLGALVVAGTACAGAAMVFWWPGYPLGLHGASTSRLPALAVPGLAGLALITAAGALIGYRTARRSRKFSPDAKRHLP